MGRLGPFRPSEGLDSAIGPEAATRHGPPVDIFNPGLAVDTLGRRLARISVETDQGDFPAGLAAQPHQDDSRKKRPAAEGVVSDIFGLNGRRIPAVLTGHVRGRLKALAETLAAESMCELHGHLQACDHVSALLPSPSLSASRNLIRLSKPSNPKTCANRLATAALLGADSAFDTPTFAIPPGSCIHLSIHPNADEMAG